MDLFSLKVSQVKGTFCTHFQVAWKVDCTGDTQRQRGIALSFILSTLCWDLRGPQESTPFLALVLNQVRNNTKGQGRKGAKYYYQYVWMWHYLWTSKLHSTSKCTTSLPAQHGTSNTQASIAQLNAQPRPGQNLAQEGLLPKGRREEVASLLEFSFLFSV